MKMTAEEACEIFNNYLHDLGRVLVKLAYCQVADEAEQNKDVLKLDFTEALHQVQAAALQFAEIVKNES